MLLEVVHQIVADNYPLLNVPDGILSIVGSNRYVPASVDKQ